jgi:hypothetical protein
MSDLFKESIYLKSGDNKYRYALGTKGENTLYCIGVNPSTATPENYDPTITRVSHVANKNGFDSFIMLNICPLRATNPDDLPKVPDWKEHNINTDAVLRVIKNGSTVWAAWGDLITKRPWLIECRNGVLNQIRKYRKVNWVKMGELTKYGNPRHPLYLKYQPFSEFKIGETNGK